MQVYRTYTKMVILKLDWLSTSKFITHGTIDLQLKSSNEINKIKIKFSCFIEHLITYY